MYFRKTACEYDELYAFFFCYTYALSRSVLLRLSTLQVVLYHYTPSCSCIASVTFHEVIAFILIRKRYVHR